jgi:hypothetical protein
MSPSCKFNIDECKPAVYLKVLDDIDKAADEKAWNVPNRFVHLYNYRIKVDAMKLLDWRALEARYNELEVITASWSTKFWNILASELKKCESTDVNELWVYSAYDDRTIIYDLRGCFWYESRESMIKSCLEEPMKRRSRIIDGELADLIWRCQTMERRMRKRTNAYMFAFRAAVEARLNPLVRAAAGKYNEAYVTYVISNCDRVYVIKSKNEYSHDWSEDTICVSV